MNIKGNDLIKLMFKSMTDTTVIETIDKLGFQQPILDEQYEMDLEAIVRDERETGIVLVFKEIKGYSSDGDPCLSEVDFEHDNVVSAPFGLKFSNNFKECCEILEKKPNYQASYMRELKLWIVSCNENDCSISIRFDKRLSKINTIVYTPFDDSDRDNIGKIYIKNED